MNNELQIVRIPGISEKIVKSKGPVTWCNFSCNLQCNSTLKRCKLVMNVWYRLRTWLANCDGNMYLPIYIYKE